MSDAERARAGLCARCRFGRRNQNRRGSVFWQCARAIQDARFQRYPELPVAACEGFESAPPAR